MQFCCTVLHCWQCTRKTSNTTRSTLSTYADISFHSEAMKTHTHTHLISHVDGIHCFHFLFCVTSVSLWPFIACHKLCIFKLGKKQRECLYSVKSKLRHRTKVEKKTWLTPIFLKTIEKENWILLDENWSNVMGMVSGKVVLCPNAGKHGVRTACQQFHKCRYVRVISPDILKTP